MIVHVAGSTAVESVVGLTGVTGDDAIDAIRRAVPLYNAESFAKGILSYLFALYIDMLWIRSRKSTSWAATLSGNV